ncbi:MAG: diguanylate cyclase [Neisseria sp.]|uniref:diguanylate cyclase n=1 Tax=Neisseria sp. TaxID=192066 RepID=UPI0026DA82CB|nr:diguanylate cyclase [Neisseria sp.]MDO4640552.1 diguanylate cyclase [Neisseria sp.]
MLEVFVLGFWLIWSSERDISALMESLAFVGLSVLIRSIMVFSPPEITSSFMAAMAIEWAFVGILMWAINRFSTNFTTTILYTLIGASGYYWLSMHSLELAEKFIA